MIVGSDYPSDCNDLLMEVQHELYGRHVLNLFLVARRELLWADEVLDAQLLLTQQARAVESFDHRVLQDAHDIQATAYRRSHDDADRLPLDETPEARRGRYKREWSAWYAAELDALARSSGFVRYAVQAVVLANTEVGYQAERVVCELLVVRYALGRWRHIHVSDEGGLAAGRRSPA